MSVNRVGNNIFIKPYEQYEVKSYAQNGVDNPFFSTKTPIDTFKRSTQDYQEKQFINTTSLKQDLEKTKSEQGFLGKLWDGFKNLTGIGAGSSKAQQAIEDYEKGLISVEEMEHAVNGYQEGQKMAVDVVADMTSGMLSIVVFGAATAVLGPVGALLVAGTTGAISKVGIKAGDALVTGKEYTSKNLLYDTVSGGINGLLGPITNGIGNTVTKTIATKFGISILKEGAEEVAEQGIKQGFKQFAKNVVLNQSDDIIGGTLKQRAIALSAGMATDGALGGASDNMVRAALEGEDILKAGAEGFVGGFVMAPIIGGGMKLASKGAKALNNKITTSRVLPDGMNTRFRQGTTGDCALLSTIDGIMANPNTANKIKNSITRTAFGDYNVKIGDRIVRVSKDALSEEILSDTTGIKLFEVAYKQMGGSIDGEFAEVVAKQFGLNPIHITSESITDELLERVSKDSDNLILSLGIDGHYYSIKSIDPQTKMITLADPYDTSKTLKMSFNEVKAKGTSIDGGSVKKTDLPNAGRSVNEVGLRGCEIENDQEIYWEENIYLDYLRRQVYEDCGAYSLVDEMPSISIKSTAAVQTGIPKFNYDEIGKFNIKNLTLTTDQKGIRGSSIFNKPNKKYMQELKKQGIRTIIDLRAESSAGNITFCNCSGLEYVSFPIYYDINLTPIQSKEMIGKLPAFFKALDEGNFYIGCTEGTNRTDVGIALNYLLNPNTVEVPEFLSINPEKSFLMTKKVLNNLFKKVDKRAYIISDEVAKYLGWPSSEKLSEKLSKRLVALSHKNIYR